MIYSLGFILLPAKGTRAERKPLGLDLRALKDPMQEMHMV